MKKLVHVSNHAPFAVVDLFAGPGGLAEGFSKVRRKDGSRVFEISISVEKEAFAHKTLRLRSFLRQFKGHFPDLYYEFLNRGLDEPDWKEYFPEQWAAAEAEALQLTLGTQAAADVLYPRLEALRQTHGDRTIVIGGPPCQAYSLVGRARNLGNADYVFENDDRHELYKAYVDVLSRLRPTAFVMENVKGLLSSKSHGDLLFKRVLADLRTAGADEIGYELVTLAPRSLGLDAPIPSDFIIRSEEFGIPQARHRLIIVGIRKDLFQSAKISADGYALKPSPVTATVRHVISNLPHLRSGLSRQPDDQAKWKQTVQASVRVVTDACRVTENSFGNTFNELLRLVQVDFESMNASPRESGALTKPFPQQCSNELIEWFEDPKLKRLPNHSSRGHMGSDLTRYIFSSVFAEAFGRSPKAFEFPDLLAPNHANWKSGIFSDRFKVQKWDGPASTVTSHISKDGHYYIHPDPSQGRSLTVREAARLQTFPDNYVFLGNRTEQYIQVGNAVPPLLAWKIGLSLERLLAPESVT